MRLTAFAEGFTMKTSFLILIIFGTVHFVNATGNTVYKDSVGVETINGKTFIIHEVEAKETLFAISRRYGAPVGDIVGSNSQLKQGLKIGQRIKVPYISKAVIPEGAKLHNVAPGETLYSIARNYEVAVQDVKAWNELKGDDLSVGQGLVIKGVAGKATPSAAPEEIEETAKVVDESVAVVEKKEPATKVKEEKKEKATASKNEEPKVEEKKVGERIENIPNEVDGGWITHTVVKGETLFSIAKQYDAKPEDLINWNALSSNNLSLDQKLKVGRKGALMSGGSGREEAKTVKPREANVSSEAKEEYDVSESKSSSTAYKNIKESGQAEVIQGTGNHKKYLVLHREAPVGTIMRIRNEENDVTIFARVVGKLPNTGDNDKLLIKVSQAAFDQLRAVNKRFRVELSY